MKKIMKRITFLTAIFVAILSVNAAKAQIGVHIGFHLGTPYYYEHPHRVVVVNPDPIYPVYYPPKHVYYRQDHEYYERLHERRREYYHRVHEAEEHGYYGRGYEDLHRGHDEDRRW
jgi:hypothetical protein